MIYELRQSLTIANNTHYGDRIVLEAVKHSQLLNE